MRLRMDRTTTTVLLPFMLKNNLFFQGTRRIDQYPSCNVCKNYFAKLTIPK